MEDQAVPVFLFSDIEGSTQKWESFREAMARALALHDEILLSFLNRSGGKVIKHTGDGVFALFENRSALQCALALQQEIAHLDWGSVGGLKVRMALHAGEAEKRGEDYFGPVINRTARILATGWGGQIVLTPEALAASDLPTGATTDSLGTHLLKDLSDPQTLLGLVHPSMPQRKFPSLRSLSSRPNNLPSQSTPFFGREEELKKIADNLKDPSCRMVTLVGQGGMGKTRLALQAAAERLDDFADGVYFVPLAPVANADTMPSAVAAAVRYVFTGDSDMTKELVRFLKDRAMLLVLDNFEHLLTGASFVSEILKNAPRMKVLVTSRLRLNLSEEWVFELEGMPYPKGGATEPLENFGAVKFFVACAQRSHNGFSLKEKERDEVARICQLVDGVPLGIELAAAWVRALSCREIREEIEKNLDFLASQRQGVPQRQQSLRAVFEYSWNLLSDEEKKAIRAMSVFRGGFLREQAEKIAGCSLLLLSALVDKSLLRKSASGRFEMHEILRQFSAEKLKEFPEEHQAARARHGNYFCDFLATREKGLKGRNEETLLIEITKERSNIRAAWDWAVENLDAQAMNKACDALYQFYEIKFLAQEGEEAFALASSKFSDYGKVITAEQELARAKVIARQGWFCYLQGRLDQAATLMKQGLELAGDLKQAKEVGQCLHFLCAIHRSQGKFEEQEACAQQSLDIYNSLKDDWGIAWSLYHMAQRPKQGSDIEKARKYFLESLDLFRKMEYEDGIAWTLFGLGQVSVVRKDYEAAKKYFKESTVIFEKHDNKVSAGWTLIDMVRLHAHLEEHEAAFALSQRAYEAFQAFSYPLGMSWAQYYCSESAFNMKKWEDSLKTGREALRIFTEMDNLLGQAWVYTNLCRTANQCGQFEEGQIYGRKGVETFLKLNDPEGAGACQNNQAQSELGLGNFAAAEKLHLQAMENGAKVKIPWRVLEAILGLAGVRAREEKWEEALIFASVVASDPASLKELKIETSKLIPQLKTKASAAEAKAAEEKAKTLNGETLSKQLLTRLKTENKN
jgi:predicted ATPase/class 3 adenylate cyclase